MQRPANAATRLRLRVEGVVQGVGFRPFVHARATERGLVGFVANDAEGVVVEVEGPRDRLDAFLEDLRTHAPRLAAIDDILASEVPARGEPGFTIAESVVGGPRRTLVSADTATCDDCLAELFDPADRRYRYAFTNCTNCGPRYTIVYDVPYDRPNTTMAGFELCHDCRREYEDPTDRRFHAQPTCCPRCGPRLRLTDAAGQPIDGDPVEATATLLRAGSVVAVKGLGGYHLAVDARNEEAAATLRRRKEREDKPFALMVADLAAARALCHVGDVEAELLTGPERPIVLCPRREEAAVAVAVAPGRRELGLMLPYTPLHHLLLHAFGGPIVLTSGNRSDEPIAYRDDRAGEQLAGLADAWLTHDRPIHVRVDDSVVRVVDGAPLPIRRSRGYAPRPLTLPVAASRHVLAVGADLKNAVCLARGRAAFVSQHIGDLANWAALEAFEEAVDHLARLFDVHPEVVAHDLHPGYHSTSHALERGDLEPLAVQHHHAHIASCLADNGASGPVIGVAYDGTGYGTDGTVWGGELLVADLAGFRRVGYLDTVPLPGGDAAIREPWRMAASHLTAAFPDGVPGLDVMGRHAGRWDAIVSLTADPSLSVATSSAGRLFDAVAAILGVRDVITHEGQAAIELEQLALGTDPSHGYDMACTTGDDGAIVLPTAPLIRAVVGDLLAGEPGSTIAGRFHDTLTRLTADACASIRETTGLTTVALSGGVFQNVRLTRQLTEALTARGFEVLRHRRVPPNDGGISLGQAAVAAATA